MSLPLSNYLNLGLRQIAKKIEPYLTINEGSGGGGGGGGWGTTGTIATLTGDSIVDLNGHDFQINNNGSAQLSIYPDSFNSYLSANHGDIFSELSLSTDDIGNNVQFQLFTSLDGGDTKTGIIGDGITNTITYIAGTHKIWDGTNIYFLGGSGETDINSITGGILSQIALSSNPTSLIQYTADTHVFIGEMNYSVGKLVTNRVEDLNGNVLEFKQGLNDWLRMDATPGHEEVKFEVLGTENPGSISSLELYSNNDDEYYFKLRTDNGAGNNLVIEGDANDNQINYRAATHTFIGNIGIGADPVNGDYLDVINNGGTNYLNIGQTISIINATDGTAQSFIQIEGASGGSSALFSLTTSDGIGGSASINLSGDNSTITYTAVTHVFNTAISTNAGTNFYSWGAANDGGGPPGAADSTITVTIDGHTYSILAKLIS